MPASTGVQPDPSVETRTEPLPLAAALVATKWPLPNAIPARFCTDPEVAGSQLSPFVEVRTEPWVPTATKRPFPYATAFNSAPGARTVQSRPSGEVMIP